MFNQKIKKMMKEYGVKQEAIYSHLGVSRITFWSRMKDNSFSDEEKDRIMEKFGAFLM